MPPAAIDGLDAKLNSSARLVVALLREENADLKQRLEASSVQIAALTSQLGLLTEQIARQTEQLEDLRRRLFGNRTEKLPTVKEELRRPIDPDERWASQRRRATCRQCSTVRLDAHSSRRSSGIFMPNRTFARSHSVLNPTECL
jgi:chromosome segregation ATPase